MYHSEQATYYSYVDIMGERVVKPCIKSSRRPPYAMVKQLSDTVRNSLDVPEDSFAQSCLDLAFSTNPLFGYSPENDEWFAEQSRVLGVYENLFLSRPQPASLAWCVGLCVEIVTWYDLLFVKDRYLSDEYRQLISASPPDSQQGRRIRCRTLEMLTSGEWDIARIIRTFGTFFPGAQLLGERSLTVQGGLRQHLFCHCLACGILDVLCPVDEGRPSQYYHDLVLGLLIEWYEAVSLFAPHFRNLLSSEPHVGRRHSLPDTNSVPSVELLCEAADTFLRETEGLLRAVGGQDREAVVNSLRGLIWAASVFEAPGTIYPLPGSTK
jgi:hypothetical protein